MSDSMTKDDVLSALGEISQHFENCTKATYGGSHERFHRWMNAADWAAAYLNDPAPTIGGWISVKDRLPGACEDALVYIERDAWGNSNTPHRKRCIDIGCHVENGRWNIPNCGKKTLVLAWMPLPEPPKEVTGDD